jgi:ubiquinone/menaquinone biosynthesis C-methylase UbiE
LENRINVSKVKQFWENNPLCSHNIPFKTGSRDYYRYFDKLREDNESIEFSYRLHEYESFNGMKVLDIGCGNGYVLNHYSMNGAITTGIDLTWTGIQLSRKRFEMDKKNGCFLNANGEDLPFKNNSFDCVCSMGVLHHTPEIERALDEIYRVLKPGGRLILMFYNKNSYRNRILYPVAKAVLPSCWNKSLQQLRNENDGIGNPLASVYSVEDLKQMLEKFSGLEFFTGYCKREDFLFFGKYIPSLMIKFIAKRFGWFLYVKGIKEIK